MQKHNVMPLNGKQVVVTVIHFASIVVLPGPLPDPVCTLKFPFSVLQLHMFLPRSIVLCEHEVVRNT